MENQDKSVVMTGQVVYVEGSTTPELSDTAGAMRIKVKLDSDGEGVRLEDLPYAFPAMPKSMQSVPKVGEGVLVLTSELGNPNSQRYYLGPIISQPQFNSYCEFDGGRGDAVSLLDVGKPTKKQPLTAISRKKSLTEGAFPKPDDVSLIGRGQEDITLRYRNSPNGYTSEVILRSGARLEPTDTNVKYLRGNVVFNNEDPSYIKVSYNRNGLAGLERGTGDGNVDKYESPEKRQARGVTNIVSDKINLISHKDTEAFGEAISDRNDMLDNMELDEIMSRLHRAVYGDELIALLKKIVSVISNHTHPFPMKPPVIGGTELEDLQGYQYERIVSPHIRIS